MAKLKKPSKAYNPKATETKIYKLWEKSGFFNPDKLPKRHKKPFTIVIPPPNVTGELHMGHTLQHIIHDIIIRQKRMAGYKTLWLPGTDHAGIATQNKVEQKLKKEGKTRFDLGRKKFEQEVWKWKAKYGNIILGQMKQLGDSTDWSRLRFTMDKEYVKAVETAFMHYYKKGWIYRGLRVINWCVRCGTSLSDLELEYEEEKGKLWYIKYPLKNSKSEARNSKQILNSKFKTTNLNYITVATTRPETMLGDAAVAVNPKDERYKNLIGKIVVLPIQNREIPIITDSAVDPNFGTGAVKVTPLHDFNDWEIARGHKLPQYKIINERGRMTQEAGPICDGLKVGECRDKVIEELEKQNLLEKVEDFTHQVPHCYRCATTIEPLASYQWFLKMEELAKLAIKAVKNKKVKFHPKRWEKVYFEWLHPSEASGEGGLKNIRDWNISRQLWWGHRLPVWFCQTGKNKKLKMKNEKFYRENYVVSAEKPTACTICGECGMVQSEDVLDTWFSSALWPFAALGWPIACAQNKKSKIKNQNYCEPLRGSDLDSYFPTDVMITDRGIINLWVARMVFSSYEFLNKKPFSDVIIHATVLSKDGQRMSKSLGTGVDPIELINKYGADATRFGMIYQAMGGQDIRFSEEHIVAGRKFCNKLWNIARFTRLQISNSPNYLISNKIPKAKTQSAKKILSQLQKTAKTVSKDIEQYKFGHAAHALYDFVWHDFADVYIEKFKIQKAKGKSDEKLLLYALLETLKLLHPFIPFITEEIYQTLPLKNKKRLIIEIWPKK